MLAFGQYTPTSPLNFVKLNKTPPVGEKKDSLLVWNGSDKFVYMVPTSSITDKTAEVVNTITELENYNGFGLTVVVKDQFRGGVFNYVGSGVVDNGTVFNATGKGSGFWKRQYNQSEGLNVTWFGADPTNTINSSTAIENTIMTASINGGRVFFPANGIFKLTASIGDIGPGSVKHLLNDVEIDGNGSVLELDSTSMLQFTFGFDIYDINFKMSNITINCNQKANRGIYMRQQIPDNPTANRSNIYLENCKVYSPYSDDTPLITSVAGIGIYGFLDKVFIDKCVVQDVNSINATIPLKGIYVDGSNTNGIYKVARITNNQVINVTRLVNNFNDQDGINLGGVTAPSYGSSAIVEGNIVKNCRGRLLKLQPQNINVIGNYLELSAGYSTAGDAGSAVNIQQSDGILKDNIFMDYNGSVFSSFFGITTRGNDLSTKRVDVTGNKVVSPSMTYFANLWEDGGVFNSVINVENNYAVVDNMYSFIKLLGNGSNSSIRKIVANGNSVKSLSAPFLETTITTVNLSASNNLHLATAVNASDLNAALNLTNNIGIIQGDSYALNTDVVRTSNSGNAVTSYTGLNANNITGTNKIYISSGTNTPVVGGVLDTDIFATGGYQFLKRFSTEDEVYYRNKTGGAFSANWYRLASREWSNLNLVGLTGNQTVAGIKTFSSSPIVPNATTSGQPVNLGQLNTEISNIPVSQVVEIIESGKTGYGFKLRKDNPGNYGDIGNGAIDLSLSNSSSSTVGATGDNSISIGGRNTASGQGALVVSPNRGVLGESVASGLNAMVIGLGTASGSSSMVLGNPTTAASGAQAVGSSSTVVGSGIANGNLSIVAQGNTANSFGEINIGIFGTSQPGNAVSVVPTDRLLNIGNGTATGSRSNAFTILKNGLATLPSVTNALIDAEPTNKVITTKEWVNEKKQDKLTETVLGQVIDNELAIKMTPTANDEIVMLDSASGEAVTARFSSFKESGWASYTDTVYTSSSPFTINSGVTSTLPNNAGTVINTQLPSGVSSFYNSATSKFTPSNDGDYYTVTVRFKAQTTAPTAGYLDFGIDIGGALGVQFKETKIFAKGAGIEHNFSIVVPCYTGSTFIANGGLMKLTSGNGNMTVYDINFQFDRVHKAK